MGNERRTEQIGVRSAFFLPFFATFFLSHFDTHRSGLSLSLYDKAIQIQITVHSPFFFLSSGVSNCAPPPTACQYNRVGAAVVQDGIDHEYCAEEKCRGECGNGSQTGAAVAAVLPAAEAAEEGVPGLVAALLHAQDVPFQLAGRQGALLAHRCVLGGT